jgi:hypothetical protein
MTQFHRTSPQADGSENPELNPEQSCHWHRQLKVLLPGRQALQPTHSDTPSSIIFIPLLLYRTVLYVIFRNSICLLEIMSRRDIINLADFNALINGDKVVVVHFGASVRLTPHWGTRSSVG